MPSGLNFCDISRFSPQIDRIFSGKALNTFFGAQEEGFSEFHFTFDGVKQDAVLKASTYQSQQ